MSPILRFSRAFMINSIVAVRRVFLLTIDTSDAARQLCLISAALLTLHTYSPIDYVPKVSPRLKAFTAPAIQHIDLGPIIDAPVHVPDTVRRANATLLMLARNGDINSAVNTIKELEDRFNLKYNYPWVFLNEQPFTEDFKRWAFPPLRCRSISLEMGDA